MKKILTMSLIGIMVCAAAAFASAPKIDGPILGIPLSTHPQVGPPGSPADAVSVIEEMGYGDFHGVIHAHTYLSHDSEGTPSRVIQAAQTTGTSFVLMTDHPSPYSVNHGLRGMHGGVLFLPGQEINLESGGVVLGINLQKTVPSGKAQAVIDEVHRQGGLAILGHIEEHTDWTARDWDGMEIYNIHYDAILDGKIDKTIALVPLLKKDPDRVWLSILDKPVVYLKAYDEVLKKGRVTGIAANDAHQNVVYNGVQLDSYERSYGLVSTHLFLMQLTEEEIYRAIRSGHGYVCFDVFGACRGFAFTATDGKNTAIMGDDFAMDATKPSTMDVRLPKVAKIKMLRDGQLYQEVEGDKLSFALTQPGVYRVEATIQAKNKTQQWIYSNPIYVK